MSGFIDMRGELWPDTKMVVVYLFLDGKPLGHSPIDITLKQWDRLRDLSGRKDFSVLDVRAKEPKA